MKNLMISIMCLVVLVGCAPSITVNGAPPANRLVILQDPYTKIQSFSHIIRIDVTREGNEELENSVYLSPGGVEIKKNTRALYVTVRVLNEKRHEYSIWEIYDIDYANETYPYHVEHMLYSGKLSRKEITASCPIKGVGSGAFRLEIRDRKGEPMIVIGNVVYSSGKGGQEMLK